MPATGAHAGPARDWLSSGIGREPGSAIVNPASPRLTSLTNGRRRWIWASLQASGDFSRPVSGQHLRGLDLATAFELLDLLGTALFRSLAILGSDGIGIYQLLGKARFGECERRDKT
jgi:hypothetical protein